MNSRASTRPPVVSPRLVVVGVAAAGFVVLAACTAGKGGASGSPAPTATAAASNRSTAGASLNNGGLQQALADGAGVDAANLITGTIASTAPGFITVNTQRGPLRLAVQDGTRARQVAAATRADLKVDESVVVTGQRANDGTITAQSVSLNADIPGSGTSTGGQAGADRGTEFLARQRGAGGQDGGAPQFGGPGGPGAAFGGGQLTAEQADQFVQQAVASGRITAEQAAALRERLLAGIGGAGGPGDEGTPRARILGSNGTPGAGAGRSGGAGRVFGRITGIDGGALVIESNSSRVNVRLTDSTVIQRVENIPATDLPVGTTVSVAAERGADGVVRATNVIVSQP